MSTRFAADSVGSPNGTDNIRTAYEWLTGKDGLSKYTGGAIQPMTPHGAAGLLGGWTVETGKRDLADLDVVEDGFQGQPLRGGRGISQYTNSQDGSGNFLSHGRRTQYNKARQAHIDAGGDPNDITWQLQYAADEYLGKHDYDGKSLSGWTKSWDTFGQYDNVEDAATGFTVGHGGNEGYFRPSKPHLDRRIQNAQEIYTRMTTTPKPTPAPPVEVPTMPTPSVTPPAGFPSIPAAPTPVTPFGANVGTNF